MAVDKTKNTQILVTFPNEMVDQIVEYWHENKLKNRNEAIRELVEKGLKKEQSE
ncbi:ribbon-helix-helix domain-containing protein [Sutcliffiella cohnii]|uniref:ribbon-helix-helix domain-containing protein n=1 Tax=Sutcliffiella cohnii TaxID=33932 RepID=UPI002E20243C|nr:ribbon-helix-helix domain-containing protein [Sutcliffiella cohnii]